MNRRTSSSLISSSGAVRKEVQTWSHPGGKLVELGSNALRQDELLAILIGSGVRGRSALSIANAILDEYIGLYGIHRQGTIKDLAHIPGLGRRKAARILAAIELGRRLYRLTTPKETDAEAENIQFCFFQPKSKSSPRPSGPSDADLIAEIIGSGIHGRSPKVIAEGLLKKFGSFLGLFGQDMGDFMSIKGLNSVKIIRIAASLEIAKRIAKAIA